MTFDWQFSSIQLPTIHWVAFFSNVEHEVLPVISGYRITCNLYRSSLLYISSYSLTIDVTSNPPYQEILAALLHERREYTWFYCHHKYVSDII